jgi:hypothetical protein
MFPLFAAEASTPAASGPFVLYLTAAFTVAALIYLAYAMVRPERF